MRICDFCAVAAGKGPAAIVRRWPDAVALLPRGATLAAGHLLVVPRRHLCDARSDPAVTGLMATRAAELAIERRFGDFHLITNCGADAGQTVGHLHWHLLERRRGDKVTMPWSHPFDAPS